MCHSIIISALRLFGKKITIKLKELMKSNKLQSKIIKHFLLLIRNKLYDGFRFDSPFGYEFF